MNISITDMTLDDVIKLVELIRSSSNDRIALKMVEKATSKVAKKEDKVEPAVPEGYISTLDASKKYKKAKNTISYHVRRHGVPSMLIGNTLYIDDVKLGETLNDHNIHNPKVVPEVYNNPKRSYQDFHIELQNEIMDAGFDKEKDYTYIMRDTFKYMTKVYGIVWPQVEKDYKVVTGETMTSRTSLAYWLESTNQVAYRLTVGCLSSVLKEKKEKMAVKA